MRSVAQITKSRGVGAGVGTVFGAGWMAYGVADFSDLVRVPLAVIGLGIMWLILVRSYRLVNHSRILPAPTVAEQTAHREAWGWFWVNLVAEIALLNVIINLLNRPAQQIYWVPAIACVVGLHFLPMAWFFGVPFYRLTGGAMIAVAAITISGLGMRTGISPALLVAIEAILNAFILWMTAFWGVTAVALPPGSEF